MTYIKIFIMLRVQDEARAIRSLQEEVPKLKEQLSEAKGIFKGRERKTLTERIQQTEREIDRRLDKLPDILRGDGYPDVQAFMATYREAEAIVEQYNRSLADWERQVKQKSRPPRPPERESVRNRLRQLQSKADSKKHERNPLTETADRHNECPALRDILMLRKTAAMVLPIHGGIHIEIRFPVCILDSRADNSSRPYPSLFCHGFCCHKRGIVSIRFS